MFSPSPRTVAPWFIEAKVGRWHGEDSASPYNPEEHTITGSALTEDLDFVATFTARDKDSLLPLLEHLAEQHHADKMVLFDRATHEFLGSVQLPPTMPGYPNANPTT